MSNYTLAVADKLQVPVSFKLADGAKTASFSFTLTMDRLGEEDWNAGVVDEQGIPKSEKIKEQLLSITTGWRDQKFVLNSDGVPADFCREALEVMFAAVGVTDVVLKAYMKENSAKVKNS